MAPKAVRQRMSDYVANLMAQYPSFNLLDQSDDHLVAKVNLFPDTPAETIYWFLHSNKMPVEEYQEKAKQELAAGNYVGNVFLKDDKNFYVRLAERGNLKKNKSLKHLPKQTVDSVIHLRDLESAVLDLQNPSNSRLPQLNTLLYFDPEFQGTTGAIRAYEMLPVKLNYDHVPDYDPRKKHLVNTTAKDYKATAEKYHIVDDQIELKPLPNNTGMISISPKDLLYPSH
jgi:hypothetical protein